MGLQDYVDAMRMEWSYTLRSIRTQRIPLLKRTRRLMGSLVIWLIGFLFLGIGAWIIALRFEGLMDRLKPHSMSIGQITVDSQDSRGLAELFRSRFDHHFRRPLATPKETGFLEVVALDTPELFAQQGLNSALAKMTLDVSGVDVGKIVQFINQIAKPDEWIIEGDFQTQPDRSLLALRLSRGNRLIRTWYLERPGNTANKSLVLQELIDDAIFQIVYDFGNPAEQDADLVKWRTVIPPPANFPGGATISFPSRAAVAAYYEARGALGRYYANGNWGDLDVAVERLQALRAQMPEFAAGLELLATALAEKRNEPEAIHVYEQLRSALLPDETSWDQLPVRDKRRILSVDLLKATATTKLYTWQSAHEAVHDLLALNGGLRQESANAELSEQDRISYLELEAQTAVQLAYTYALYLQYIRQYTVTEMFGSPEAPPELRVTDPKELGALKPGGDARPGKQIVRQEMVKVANEHQKWLAVARQEQAMLEPLWRQSGDGERRRADLTSRLHLAAGLAHYRMMELENHESAKSDTIFGETFDARMELAIKELRAADAAHPNHYSVLQMLGLVYSEPRRQDVSLSIAEQYFERATRANPPDYYGHELLSGLLLRRVAGIGVDLTSREIIEEGFSQADKAIQLREISGPSHLLRAQFQTMLLEIERSEPKRREMRVLLDEYIEQAQRFLPPVFGRPDVELTWVRVIAATRRLGEDAKAFGRSTDALVRLIDGLIADCNILEDRWVAEQRLFQVRNLRKRAVQLRQAVLDSSIDDWREIPVSFQ